MERFAVEEVIITPELTQALLAESQQPDDVCSALLSRHVRGDWGDIHANQSSVNDVAVMLGKGTVKSVYAVGSVEVWVMTSLNTARGLKAQTYLLVAGQSFTP